MIILSIYQILILKQSQDTVLAQHNEKHNFVLIFMQFGKGSMYLIPPSTSLNTGGFGIRLLFHSNRRLPDGKATVQVSTDPELLKRALKDITDNYNAIDLTVAAPTHLLLFNNIDIKASSSTQV